MKNHYKCLNKKIYVAGHSGMVGSAITDELIKRGYKDLLLKDYPGLNPECCNGDTLSRA
jgi:nucleoside-diphosphate-sugar epimerase